MDQKLNDERRLTPRVTLKASVRLGSETNFYTGFTNDISEGGLFVATHQVLPRGTVIRLECDLPDGKDPIVVMGEVRWQRVESPTSDTPPGMGLQFIDLAAADRIRIEAFVRAQGETLFYDE